LQKRYGEFRFFSPPSYEDIYFNNTEKFYRVVPLGTLENKEIFETHVKMLSAQGFG
jgi:hypothetical protein